MKKKILIALTCISMITLLAGCGESYPEIVIHRSLFESEEFNITVGDEYKYKSFEKENTADGCAVTLYFEDAKRK